MSDTDNTSDNRYDIFWEIVTSKNNNEESKGRIIGYLPNHIPIYGSKSELVKELTINDIAPFEIFDTKEKIFDKNNMNQFKKYMNQDNSIW